MGLKEKKNPKVLFEVGSEESDQENDSLNENSINSTLQSNRQYNMRKHSSKNSSRSNSRAGSRHCSVMDYDNEYNINFYADSNLGETCGSKMRSFFKLTFYLALIIMTVISIICQVIFFITSTDNLKASSNSIIRATNDFFDRTLTQEEGASDVKLWIDYIGIWTTVAESIIISFFLILIIMKIFSIAFKAIKYLFMLSIFLIFLYFSMAFLQSKLPEPFASKLPSVTDLTKKLYTFLSVIGKTILTWLAALSARKAELIPRDPIKADL